MKLRNLGIALLSVALWSCSGAPDAPDEKPVEKAAETVSVDEPRTELPSVTVDHEVFKLDNGLTVIVHTDKKAPVVAVNVWYHVGSKDEPPGKSGFAHLFEHLMFQGSENWKGEFFEPLEDAGATDMNGTTNRDRTNYFQTVPKSALDLALWMEADRMGHFAGAISQELLDEQRGVVQNEKRQGQNRPYGKAWELIPPNTYPEGHPYSWSVIGSMDDLNAASLEDVKNWFKTYYGASNAVLVLAGDITVDQAKEKAEKHFGHIEAGPAVQQRGDFVAPMDETKGMTIYDQVPQERVYRVFNVPPYGGVETEHLRLGALVLGSGKNSRLFERLVYRDQLATNVYVWFGDGEIGSQLYFVADARPGVPLEKVEAALDEEIAKFIEAGATQAELNRVRMSYFSGMVKELEKVGGFGGKANLLAKHQTFLGDASAYQRIHETLADATLDDVKIAATNWLTKGSFVLRILPDPNYKAAKAESAVDRSKLPEVGPTPSLDLPDLQRTELSNGIKVVLAERHDIPLVRFMVMAEGGFSGDSNDELGLATLAMDVLDEGADGMSSLELAAELEKLGADMSTSASLEFSTVTLTSLTTTLGPSMDLLSRVLKKPDFEKEEFERRRKQQLATIAQENARPFSTALRLLGPLLFGENHRYGVPLTGSGKVATLEALERDDLVRFHQQNFRPERLELLVVGDTTMAELKPMLEERFGSWKAEGEPAPARKNVVKAADGSKVYLIDKPGAEQSLIVAGNVFAERSDVNPIAVDLMNAAIGGTFTSRINMNLREDKHWSYGARSFVFETLGKQLFGAYANVQTDKTRESIVEINRELREYTGSRPITDDELGRIKQNKTRKLPGENETTSELLGSIREIVMYGLPDDYFDTYVPRVQNMDRQEVIGAAKEVIDTDGLTYIIIGDLSKIEAGVRGLELGPVEILEIDKAAK